VDWKGVEVKEFDRFIRNEEGTMYCPYRKRRWRGTSRRSGALPRFWRGGVRTTLRTLPGVFRKKQQMQDLFPQEGKKYEKSEALRLKMKELAAPIFHE